MYGENLILFLNKIICIKLLRYFVFDIKKLIWLIMFFVDRCDFLFVLKLGLIYIKYNW